MNDLDITDKLLNEVQSRQVEAKWNLIDSFELHEYIKTDGVLVEDILCSKYKAVAKTQAGLSIDIKLNLTHLS